MGLDMYLTKRTYVGNKYREPEKRVQVEGRGIKQDRVQYIEEEVGYWRKANAIHAWFVANVCGGADDCTPHEVSREQMAALLAVVRRLLAELTTKPGPVYAGTTFKPDGKGGIATVRETEPGQVIVNPELAAELLPTQAGFFFGGTDYDDGYLADLHDTEEILAAALAEKDDAEYLYRASW